MNNPFYRWLFRQVEFWWLPVLLVLLWWVLSEDSTSFFFPPLSKIISVLYRDLASGLLMKYLAVSLSNMAAGLSIATVLGVVLGLIIGESRTLQQATEPTLNFLRSIPPAAIVPIVIVAMGIGPAPKVFIIALACFWPILLNTIDGIRGVPPQMIETARAFKIPLHLMLARVLFMSALPQIMAGIRVAVAVALVLMVISEFFGASEGIGFYISESKQRFAMTETWAGTILIGLLGYVLSTIFLKIERWLLAWYFQDPSTKKMKQPVYQT